VGGPPPPPPRAPPPPARGAPPPPPPGRYHLYISWACPWAHRSAIVRELLGLGDVISLSAVDPIRDGRGWAFREGPGYSLDPVNGFALLREAYDATEPGYDGHVSVPVLWDRETGRIVSNNFPEITIDLDTQFGAYARGDYDLYPERLRPEINAINAVVYENVNNGVYRSGMATTQDAYHDAVTRLFATLDDLEDRLAGRRYLLGDAITEADVRLWVTLVRFDSVYHYHFKANLRRLTDYPNLWGYARDLYALPAFRDTTNFDHIKRHYFTTHPHINPTRIVPDGPRLDWDAPPDRSSF
jgi:glutathionyl-hydroquinone reductase